MQTKPVFYLPPFFADGMVLQAEQRIRLWGRYPTDGELTVRITDADGRERYFSGCIVAGRFEVWLESYPYGGPYTIELMAETGDTYTIQDVLFGDVFLFGGQSNMALWIKDCHIDSMDKLLFQADVECSANTNIRSFTVYPFDAEMPQKELNEHPLQVWQSASPETVPTFAAVPYFFSREIHRQYGRPVGMIVASVGATAVQCWIPPEELKQFGVPMEILGQIAEREPVNYIPSRYYNGMIAPLAGLAFQGLLWYQGEGNMAGLNSAKEVVYAGYHKYGDYLKAVIDGWRRTLESPELPVAIVQLPRFVDEGAYFWAREEDKRVCSLVENATYSVNIDAGLYPENVVPGDPINEGHGIHPYDKDITGTRLARTFMGHFWNESGIHVGPRVRSVELVERQVLVRLDCVGAGLCLDGELAGFELADPSGVFHAAVPTLVDAESVLVKTEGLLNPIAVRYGFTNKSPLITKPLLSCRQSVCVYNTITDGGEPWLPAEQFWISLY